MTYLELINRFWAENRRLKFAATEVCLYFYLLDEANRNFWRMPIACPTSAITAYLSISKPSLKRGRDSLRQRGLIDFSDGVQNSKPPAYIITGCDIASETDGETARETAGETFNKDTDKEKDKNLSLSAREEIKSLEVLEKEFLVDTRWHEQILKDIALKGLTLPVGKSITDFIREFFSFLSIQGFKEREEKDCRAYFYNKLIKNYLKPNQKNDIQQYKSQRRGVDVKASENRDYYSTF